MFQRYLKNVWSGDTARIAIKRKVRETSERTDTYEKIPYVFQTNNLKTIPIKCDTCISHETVRKKTNNLTETQSAVKIKISK